MARAIWNGEVIAESESFQLVEGIVYFPPETVRWHLLTASDRHTRCPWKGTASYYDVVVDGEVNRNAAWCYPEPTTAASHFKGHIAFWKGVRIEP